MIPLLTFAGFTVLVLVIVVWSAVADEREYRGKRIRKELASTKSALAAAEKLLTDIRETAYQHDEIDHVLSTTIRGMINEHLNGDRGRTK